MLQLLLRIGSYRDFSTWPVGSTWSFASIAHPNSNFGWILYQSRHLGVDWVYIATFQWGREGRRRILLILSFSLPIPNKFNLDQHFILQLSFSRRLDIFWTIYPRRWELLVSFQRVINIREILQKCLRSTVVVVCYFVLFDDPSFIIHMKFAMEFLQIGCEHFLFSVQGFS